MINSEIRGEGAVGLARITSIWFEVTTGTSKNRFAPDSSTFSADMGIGIAPNHSLQLPSASSSTAVPGTFTKAALLDHWNAKLD